MDAAEEELALLAAMVREHLAWEERLGGGVVPSHSPEARAAAAPALESPVAAPAPAAASTSAGAAPAAPARVSAASSSGSEAAPVAPAARQGGGGLSAPERIRHLDLIAAEAASCTRCGLAAGRTRSVFARGTPETPIAFVGEGPGHHEDQEGSPFVGAAGQLLDKMVVAMGFARDEVYVCNVVKCRPPENRTPTADEAAACEPFLTRQLEIVAPQVIVALGRCAAENLGCAEPGRSWRGMWGTWRGIPVMPTYHPAFLLRSPEMKRPVWEDLQKVVARIGRTPPSRKG